MARMAPMWFILVGLSCFFVTQAYGENLLARTISGGNHHETIFRLKAFKTSLTKHDSIVSLPPSSFSPSSSPSPQPLQGLNKPHVYLVTSYGADPTGNSDSTEALLAAISDAAKGPSKGFLMKDINDLGGAQIDLQGGNYMISKPLQLPVAGVGNLMIHGGTIRASNNFPSDGYLIDLSNTGESKKGSTSTSYNYEYITFKDLLLDSNFTGGGISVINSLRINIDNCYITHFTTTGILVQSGHETYIRNSFLGQHITAGGDKKERDFSGTGISLQGNDNAVTDVVIFSASIGIMVTGQANTFSGVHCYNKASGFGGTGIYLKLPGLTQTRIVNSYMDYTKIVVEDPVQVHISSSFFLGDANIVLKSIKGVVNGLSIVDNMFSGLNNGVEIVKLDQSNSPFNQIDQVFVARNIVKGMNLKATSAKMSMHGNGTSWIGDFNKILLFPNLIKHVQYSLSTTSSTFPNHALRNVSGNRIVIETDEAVTANVFVTVDQSIVS
ncbi:polygalacturonase QRT3-like [Gastrolobium bilobum]|uniref:polygalacturonase QRT3-like n=1 Tax=Gastrolobium bilobum TaxID=150636 RepID=UPI002AAF3DFA|nr:polygalacturonase QRT3-like [Gastrolobium bilobum]